MVHDPRSRITQAVYLNCSRRQREFIQFCPPIIRTCPVRCAHRPFQDYVESLRSPPADGVRLLPATNWGLEKLPGKPEQLELRTYTALHGLDNVPDAQVPPPLPHAESLKVAI